MSKLKKLFNKNKLAIFVLFGVLLVGLVTLSYVILRNSNLGAQNSSASGTDTKKDIINYIADGPGKIVGKARQDLRIGEWGTVVKAVPNRESEFRGWSRTMEVPSRTERGNGNSRTLIAYFQKIGEERDMVEYVIKNPELGTFADGTTSRTVMYMKEGESGREITVKPVAGAEFVGWSDGYTNPTRKDEGKGEYRRYVATFKKQGEEKYKVVYDISIIKDGNEVHLMGPCPTREACLHKKSGYPGIAYIEGEHVQYLSKGEKGKEVIARPYGSVYEFSGWKDGVKADKRTDIGDGKDKTIEVKFKEVKERSTCKKHPEGEYSPSSSGTWEYKTDTTRGYILGTRVQTANDMCDYGTPVRAIRYGSYRFKYWELGRVVTGCSIGGIKGKPSMKCKEDVVWVKDTSPQAESPYRWDKEPGLFRAVFEKINTK